MIEREGERETQRGRERVSGWVFMSESAMNLTCFPRFNICKFHLQTAGQSFSTPATAILWLTYFENILMGNHTQSLFCRITFQLSTGGDFAKLTCRLSRFCFFCFFFTRPICSGGITLSRSKNISFRNGEGGDLTFPLAIVCSGKITHEFPVHLPSDPHPARLSTTSHSIKCEIHS